MVSFICSQTMAFWKKHELVQHVLVKIIMVNITSRFIAYKQFITVLFVGF